MRSKWFCKYKLAHRGLHDEESPENSLGAFEKACQFGCAIELDVRLLKDDTVVVFHDPDLQRMCGVDIHLNTLSIDDLRKYNLCNSKYYIPTLKETLNLVAGRCPLMIELKPLKRKDHLEEKVYELLKDYKGEFAIKSFNPFTMMWFKKHAPHVLRGMLSSYFENIPLPRLYKFAIKRLWFFKKIKPDFISYNYLNLPNKYAKKNVPILAWTIGSKEEEKIAMERADNVIFENYIPDSPTNE